MSELDPESMRLLALARDARTPTEVDRARVAKRLGLTAGVAGAAATQTVVASSAQAASVPAPLALASHSAGEAVASSGGATGGAGATAPAGLGAAIGKVAQGTAAVKALGAGAAWGPIKLGMAGALLVSAAAATYLERRPTAPAAPAAESSEARPAGVPAPRSDPPRLSAAETVHETAAEPTSITDAAPRARRPARNTPRAVDSNTLAAELDLLHRAQSAWREHQSARALELLSLHRRRYRSSALRAEREALRILVLCEAGEIGQAARLARALLKREPNSPARAAIEESCAATGSKAARVR